MNSRELSVVIQGPIHEILTPLAIASIRQFLPNAEIILSTWQNETTHYLDIDTLILSEDPGTAIINAPSTSPVYNNINRQIVSTRNGLRVASRPYAIKLRSDFILTKALDSPIFQQQLRNSKFAIFQQNVVCLNIYTRNPLQLPVLFHITDLFMLGLTADLLTYWDVPLVDHLKFSNWMTGRKLPWIHAFPNDHYNFRCTPEQYLGECMAKKLFQFKELQHVADGSWKQLFIFVRLLANNFIILNPADAGVLLPERMAVHVSDFDLYHTSSILELEQFRRERVRIFLRVKFALLYSLKRQQYSKPLLLFRKWKKLPLKGFRKVVKSLKAKSIIT